MSDWPDPVQTGGNVTLSLSSASDSDGIANVKFYREANGISGLQAELGDVLVGTDTTSPYSAVVSTGGLPEGTYTYYARATDSWGAVSAVATTTNIISNDTTPPTIASVSSTVSNGQYKIGSVIPITVTFSEPVIVQGMPRLTLETGAVDAVVNYSSGSGTNVLTFNYTVAAGHTSSDLDYVSSSALTLAEGPSQQTFNGSGSISVPSSGTASPYPSTISVSGVPGAVVGVTVTLNNINHTYPDDLDVLLVGPAGQSVILMSDVGGSADLVNVTLTFDDAATQELPDNSQLYPGTYRPTNKSPSETFPSPAPSGAPSGTGLWVFNGVNPNGTWSLYVMDDASGDAGSIAGGWSLTITSIYSGAIRDNVGNNAVLTLPVPGAPGSLGANKNIIVDGIVPMVTINQSGSQPDPTRSSPINFTAVFSEPVSGFGDSASDVVLGGTAGPTTSVVTQIAPMNGTTYNVAVSGMVRDGTVTVSIPSGAATDAAGNPNLTSASSDNTVTYDGTAPFIIASFPQFNFLTSPQSLTYRFSEAVSGIISGNFTVTNVTTSTVVPLSVAYDPQTFTATLTWPSFNGGTGRLIDGNYTASASAAITDLVGNPLASNLFSFFFMNADADHDRDVDNADFGVLFSHFGQSSGATFADGDFDYDGDVDNSDFGVFFGQFNATLPEPALPAALSASTVASTASSKRRASRVVVQIYGAAFVLPATGVRIPVRRAGWAI